MGEFDCKVCFAAPADGFDSNQMGPGSLIICERCGSLYIKSEKGGMMPCTQAMEQQLRHSNGKLMQHLDFERQIIKKRILLN